MEKRNDVEGKGIKEERHKKKCEGKVIKFVPLIFLEALCDPHKGNNNNNNTVVIITAQLRIRIKSKHSDPLILEAQIRIRLVWRVRSGSG